MLTIQNNTPNDLYVFHIIQENDYSQPKELMSVFDKIYFHIINRFEISANHSIIIDRPEGIICASPKSYFLNTANLFGLSENPKDGTLTIKSLKEMPQLTKSTLSFPKREILKKIQHRWDVIFAKLFFLQETLKNVLTEMFSIMKDISCFEPGIGPSISNQKIFYIEWIEHGIVITL